MQGDKQWLRKQLAAKAVVRSKGEGGAMMKEVVRKSQDQHREADLVRGVAQQEQWRMLWLKRERVDRMVDLLICSLDLP
jgi:hypothetical protein